MSRHVLVVDDDPGTRDLLCRTLSGHCQGRTVGVENTATALKVLRENRIDLIVQDLFRPHGNGFEFLAVLHADPALSKIPVMVVSGQGTRYDQRARQLGAAIVLQKPVSKDELVCAVDLLGETLRQLKRSMRGIETRGGEPMVVKEESLEARVKRRGSVFPGD